MEDRSVGVIPVYKKGDQWLFCLVRHAAGHWGFPKGHKEEGESDDEAALRELREETGIEKIDLVRDWKFSERYSFVRDEERVDKTVTYFLGFAVHTSTETQDAFKDEIRDCRWMLYQEAEEILAFPEAKKLLREVWEYLQKSLK